MLYHKLTGICEIETPIKLCVIEGQDKYTNGNISRLIQVDVIKIYLQQFQNLSET